MINIEKAKISFKNFLNQYELQSHLSFKLKTIHTYHVAENSKYLAKKLNLSEEDILLAELIGLLHDIGRFEEIKVTQEMNSLKFDHAYYGAKILFDDGLIRNFIEDSQYDNIIRKAIENHSKIKIEDGLDERCLLHAKIIRDADKLDNYRVKIEENIESVFPKKVKDKEALEYSTMSNKIYEAVLARQCVDIRYRVTPLDFWVSILAFTFDLNFNASYQVVKENNYINILIDKFNYQIPDSKEKMESVRNILNKFVEKKLNE